MTVVSVDSVQRLHSVQQSIILILILFIISKLKMKTNFKCIYELSQLLLAILCIFKLLSINRRKKFHEGKKGQIIHIFLFLFIIKFIEKFDLQVQFKSICEITNFAIYLKLLILQFLIWNLMHSINQTYNIISITTNMKLSFIILLFATLYYVQSAKVVDLYGTFSNFSCLIQQGYYHSIIRAYHSYGAIDTDAASLIQQSNKAGLSTDVYMFPCRGKNATIQVNQLIDYLQKMKAFPSSSTFEYTTGTIWLDIETNPSSGCTWSIGSPQSNCQYLKELVTAIESRGRAVGIYASAYMWNQIFGSKDVCASFTSYPLWYAHYDGKQDFNDWQTSKFAGWTTPTLKQYAGDSALCGYKVDLSYY